MAKDQQKRLGVQTLAKNTIHFEAMKAIEGYESRGPSTDLGNVQTLHDTMVQLQSKEAKAEVAFKSLRDDTIDAEWAFYNAMLVCKDNVRSQFGQNSNQLQAVGLKKKLDYKRKKKKAAVVEMKHVA